MVPLGEVVRSALGASSPRTKQCRTLYDRFIETFGDEINALTRAEGEDLATVHPLVASMVLALRAGEVTFSPGGGGRYGSFSTRR